MTQLNLSGFVELAAALHKPIVLFDLESTTFRGKPNFGITEAAFLTALPVKGAGGVVEYGSLVNPENRIDAKVSELTGISQAMVDRAEPWHRQYLKHFQEWAPKAYFTGFNIGSFDLPAVKDQATRYGAEPPEFPFVFDVRTMHRKLSNATTQAGKLQDVAASYGVRPRGDLHRASADVALTAETLCAMVRRYGLDVVRDFIVAPEGDKTTVLSPQNIARYVKSNRARTVAELAVLFKQDEAKVSYEAGRMLDEGVLDEPELMAHGLTQDWLWLALDMLPESVRRGGKLREIHASLLAGTPPNGVQLDYVQLRLAMRSLGLCWSTMKAPIAS